MAASKKKTKKKAQKKTALTINVTQQHIDDGFPGDNQNCPISLAFLEKIASTGISVSHYDIDVDGTTASFTFSKSLPKAARDFIIKFDEEKPRDFDFENGKKDPAYIKAVEKWKKRVKPFSFSL